MTRNQILFPYSNRIVQIILILLLIACSVKLFFGPIVWAGIISITVWPLFLRLRNQMKGPFILAFIGLMVLWGVVVLLPVSFGIYRAGIEFPCLCAYVLGLEQIRFPDLSVWFSANLPLIGGYLAAWWQTLPADSHSLIYMLQNEFGQFELLRSVLVGKFISVVMLSGFFIASGDIIRQYFESIVREFCGVNYQNSLARIARSIRNIALTVIGSVFVPAVLTGVGLFIAGVSSAVSMGIVCFLLAMLRMPVSLIWISATIWLFLNGSFLFAGLLVIWGMVQEHLMSTIIPRILPVLYPVLDREVPVSVVSLGMVGGLLSVGILGLIAGPIMTMTVYAMLCNCISDQQYDDLKEKFPEYADTPVWEK